MSKTVNELQVSQLRAPFAADERAIWDRGERFIRWGSTWPIPFLRPWLRQQGHELKERAGWREIVHVRLGDWVHAPLYDTIDFSGQWPKPSWPRKLRSFYYDLRYRLGFESDAWYALVGWLVRKGVW